MAFPRKLKQNLIEQTDQSVSGALVLSSQGFNLFDMISIMIYWLSQEAFLQADQLFPFFVQHLTVSLLLSKTGTCTNSADPDETARNEPSHQDLHSLPFCF